MKKYRKAVLMTPHDIDFIRARWSHRACGPDIQKLVNEIDRLSKIVHAQTDTIEGGMLDELETERKELIGKIEALEDDVIEGRAYSHELCETISRLRREFSQTE